MSNTGRLLPGIYYKVHNECSPSNKIVTRTHKGIAMQPSGNLQGRIKFCSLNTGQILKWYSFAPYPMPVRVMKKVCCKGSSRNKKLIPYFFGGYVCLVGTKIVCMVCFYMCRNS
jgi:hypothetical protein